MSSEWFVAAERGDTEALRCLLDRGADINAKGDHAGYHGVTALMLAVDGGRIEAIEFLIRPGAQLEVENNMGWTAMTFASLRAPCGLAWPRPGWPERHRDNRPAESLEAAGGRFGLREAVLTGDVELARRLCDAHPAINVSGDARFCWDITHLMLAAELGSLEMVNFLIDRGADIEGTDDLGNTAIMSAANAGHAVIVSRLLDRGAEVDRNWPDQTALSMAEANGHQEVAALLRTHGAKYRLVDAVDRDDLMLLKELLRDGASPENEHVLIRNLPDFHDSEDECLTRPAMYAVGRGNIEIVRLLLDHGVPLHIKMRDAHSLLAEAARHGRNDVVRLLIERGADVHDVGRDGLTPLEWAVMRGDTAVAEQLKQAGASR